MPWDGSSTRAVLWALPGGGVPVRASTEGLPCAGLHCLGTPVPVQEELGFGEHRAGEGSGVAGEGWSGEVTFAQGLEGAEPGAKQMFGAAGREEHVRLLGLS